MSVTSYTSRVPLMYCPTCHTQLDAATSMEEIALPQPGDVTICIMCANILQFDGEMNVRVVDVEKLKKAPEEIKRKLFIMQQCALERIIEEANGGK